jgi:serine/threonine protein phosphatase PrpC
MSQRHEQSGGVRQTVRDTEPMAPRLAPGARVVLDIGARSDPGRVRENNEDAYLVFRIGRFAERVMSNIPESELPSRFDDAGTMMIVADGLGGHEAGDVASRTALITTLHLILRSPRWALKLDDPATRDAELRDMMTRSRGYLAAVHAALRHRAAEDPRLAGMGTTLTGAYTVGGDLFVLHVGDSKAYLMRGDSLRKITHDHTVAQQYADLGVIPQEQVASHRQHHVLTKAVGGPDPNLEGDLHHLRIAAGDRLLLCSDGLTDMLSDEDIAGVMKRHPASGPASTALVDLALEHGGRDNVTVIVAGFRVE